MFDQGVISRSNVDLVKELFVPDDKKGHFMKEMELLPAIEINEVRRY